MKKFLMYIGLVFLLLILFRGPLFRILIKYNEIGEREEIKITNQNLLNKIDTNSSNQALRIDEIIRIAKLLTNQELRFTFKSASGDPNKIFDSKKANCVGYSAMFNSLVNHLLHKNGLQAKYTAKHKIGQIKFCGINTHQFLNGQFFKDHDYNEIINLETESKIIIDPSISDFFRF